MVGEGGAGFTRWLVGWLCLAMRLPWAPRL